jgi:hypothetical protein
MGRRRTIIKHMSKMRTAARASYFITRHPMAGVRGFDYFVSRQRCIETWPPGVRLKFRVGAEELIAACAAEINSLFVIVPIRVLVWRLCFRFAQDLKLAWSQDLSPLVITQCHLLRHRSGLDLPPDSSNLCIFRQTEVDGQNKEQKQGKRFHSLAALGLKVSSDRVS